MISATLEKMKAVSAAPILRFYFALQILAESLPNNCTIQFQEEEKRTILLIQHSRTKAVHLKAFKIARVQ